MDEELKPGQFIKIYSEFTYRVFLLKRHLNNDKWVTYKVFQSSDGFKVFIGEEITDLSSYVVYSILSGERIYKFYDWLFDTIFIDPSSIIMQ